MDRHTGDGQRMPRTPMDRRDFLRVGAAVAAVPAVGGVLAACAGGSSQGALGAGQRSGGKVSSLTIATAETPWLNGYLAMIKEYEKKSGIQITVRQFPFDGLRTQMITALQNLSHTFDVLQINEQWTGEFYNNGWLTPISSVNPHFTPDSQLISYKGVGRWDKAQQVTSNTGTLYALPINGNAHIYTYRQDILQELNAKAPRTFEQAIALGKAAVKAGKVKYGYTTRGTNTVSFDFSAVLNGNGGDWFVAPGTDWTPRIDDAIGIASMETYLELLALGPQPAQTVAQSQVGAAIQSGQALQGHMVAALGGQFEDPQQSRVAGKLGYAPVPAGTKTSAPQSGTWVLGLPAQADPARAKASLDFITWLVGKTPMTQWAQSQGGIPTREDALRAASGPKTGYLGALADERSTYFAGFRYTFAAAMVQAIEPPLANIVSHSISVPKGMAAVASALAKVVKDAGVSK